MKKPSEESGKAQRRKQRAAYRAEWPRSRKGRYKHRKIGKRPMCPECKTRHDKEDRCPQLPRIICVK